MSPLNRESPIPLYHQIERALLDLIRQRELTTDSLFPSEPELARQFGVTRFTVRQAIERLVQQGVLYREQGRGTFVADPTLARQSTTGSTLTVVLPYEPNLIHLLILQGIEQEARRHGLQTTIKIGENDAAIEAQKIEAASTSAGVLVWTMGSDVEKQALRRLQEQGIPLILIDRYLFDINTDSVVVDDFAGAYQVTKHLIDLGHRRIALVTSERASVSSVQLREDGYRRALADAGLAFDQQLIAHHPTIINRADLTEMVAIGRGLLSLASPPTAAFCINDSFAQALLIVLQREGISVPTQFSVAGFDGLDYFPVPQRVTTVRRATKELGREAVRLLLGRLNDRIEGGPRRIVLPVEFVKGDTSAPVPH